MATMTIHLRVAERVFDNNNIKNEEQYFAGIIAPDCSETVENWSIPVSSDTVPKISHWIDTGDKINCDYNKFFNSYISGNLDSDGISFYIGYYTHLLTDVLWCKSVTIPLLEKYKEQINDDINFIKEIKRDWRELDSLYIKEHPDFRAFKVLNNITSFPNTYLSYYSDRTIENLIKNFCSFYKGSHEYIDRPHIYLNAAQLNSLVNETAAYITNTLNEFLNV